MYVFISMSFKGREVSLVVILVLGLGLVGGGVCFI